MDQATVHADQALQFLAAGGEMGALMRSHDWADTQLGPAESWPRALKTALRLLLNTGHPMYVFWGPDLLCFYNDAYRLTLGPERHPGSLGRPGREVWAEIWPLIGHQVDFVMAGQGSTWDENRSVPITRFGRLEEIYWTYSYSPIDDETAVGGIGGVLVICTETTDVVLAERRLASETERQRRLFDQAPGFIAILTGPEHVFEFVNNTYYRLFGRRDFKGRRVREAFPELAEQDFFALLDGVYASGERFVASALPIVLQAASPGEPTERFLDFIYEPVRDASGAVTGIFVEGYDVTDHVRAEAALRESEARYRTLFENIDSGFCVVEVDVAERSAQIDYRVVEANPAFYAQTGFTFEILGRWLRDAAPTLEEHWYERYGRIALTGEPERFEQGSDHLARWFDVYAFRMGEASERRVAILFNDITPRRLAENQLRDLNETLEEQVAARSAERDRLWNLSEDMLARADFTGMMSAVSPSWTPVLGWSETELLTRGYANFMHPDDTTPTLEAIGRMSETGLPTRFENRIATRDGGWKHIEWTVAPEPDGANFIAIGRDVSLSRARETELLRAQEQLRQSQKMEAMGQLTGGVAHDFNNLLMPIIGSLDMLSRREVGTERERRMIDGALQSAERAKVLVQRLLAFARRQPLQSSPVDLGRLVSNMAELVDSTTGPRVDVRLEIEENLPAAQADANQLEMAILNLAVNARDAMPDGGLLTVSTARAAVRPGDHSNLKPGHYLRLSVTDTGVGMDEATRARAVEPFFSTKGIGKGTGLGLSMVHGLASQLGGDLTIESRAGEGTAVSLWLPMSSAEPTWDLPADSKGQPRRAAGAALLIDDEDLVRMTAADMLAELGFEVTEAASAEDALVLLHTGFKPDLIVTDHLMPGLTGAELAERVRLEWPKLPILIVSGYAEADGLAPGLSSLTKPFRNSELAEKLIQIGALSAL